MARLRYISLLTAAVVAASLVQGAESALYREVRILGGYSDADEWISEYGIARNAVGIEYFAKYAAGGVDRFTADLQARISYDSRLDEEASFELHNAWLEWKAALGRNIRFGHFQPAYGLEPSVDTHGRVFQTLAPLDLGIKHDWGVMYRGTLGAFDLSVALQTGSGMGFEQDDGSHLATARLALPAGAAFTYGASLLAGDVLIPDAVRTFPRPDYADETVRKERVGVHGAYDAAAWMYRGEVSYGRDEGESTAGGLAEVNYTVPDLSRLVLTLQGRYWSGGPADSEMFDVGAGATLQFNRDWSVTGAVIHAEAGEDDDTVILVQLYYYGS